MLVGHPREGLHRLRPLCDFPGQLDLLRLSLPDELPNIYLLPVTTLSPIPLKNSSDRTTLHGVTNKILFVSSKKLPLGGTLSCRSRRWATICANFPPASASSKKTCLCFAGVCPPKFPYERDYPYVIGDHGKGVPMGHALLAVQEVT